MKRAAPKRKPRTFKVWALLVKPSGRLADVANGCFEDAEAQFGHMDPREYIVPATLTLSGGKGKGK